ncbi:MAG: CPBP family intramembrane glutamic endopeptidase [Caldilineaceae bacterium]
MMQNSAIVQSAGALNSVQQARRGLVIYFAILLPLTALIEGYMIKRGAMIGLLVLLLMFMPTLASVIARLTLREGFGDVSFRVGGRRSVEGMLLALIQPILVGLIAYGIAWSVGLADFVPPASTAFPAVQGAMARFGLLFLAALIGNFVPQLIGGVGEEIGWRGYMLTRLIDARVPYPVLTSGLIWGAWHLPLLLSGLYQTGPNVLLSALLFMAAVIALSWFYAQLRLGTGSIWPAIILHGASNCIFHNVFDASTSGAQATLWIGESGILVMLAVVAVSVLLTRFWRPSAA